MMNPPGIERGNAAATLFPINAQIAILTPGASFLAHLLPLLAELLPACSLPTACPFLLRISLPLPQSVSFPAFRFTDPLWPLTWSDLPVRAHTQALRSCSILPGQPQPTAPAPQPPIKIEILLFCLDSRSTQFTAPAL